MLLFFKMTSLINKSADWPSNYLALEFQILKFPQITVLLNRSTCHKSAKTVPTPPPQISLGLRINGVFPKFMTLKGDRLNCKAGHQRRWQVSSQR